MRTLAKKYIPPYFKNEHSIKYYLYKSEITFLEKEVLELNDWGAPRSAELSKELSENCNVIESDRAFFKKLRKGIINFSTQSSDPKKIKGRRADYECFDFQERSIKLIKYKNHYDMNDAEFSFCVVDTSILSNSDIEEIKKPVYI